MEWLGKLEEREVKIALIPKEWTNADTALFRVSCERMNCGWGETLESAIKDFDEQNK